MKTVSSINVEEVAKFEKLANEWWDAEGKFKPLHMLNPCRLEFITDHLSLNFAALDHSKSFGKPHHAIV